jgi:hypothetical protein
MRGIVTRFQIFLCIAFPFLVCLAFTVLEGKTSESSFGVQKKKARLVKKILRPFYLFWYKLGDKDSYEVLYKGFSTDKELEQDVLGVQCTLGRY